MSLLRSVISVGSNGENTLTTSLKVILRIPTSISNEKSVIEGWVISPKYINVCRDDDEDTGVSALDCVSEMALLMADKNVVSSEVANVEYSLTLSRSVSEIVTRIT